MKKIALVVAAILVIGIQGCSTDDKPEQLGDTVPDNFIHATNAVEGKSLNGGGGSFERIFVVYPPGSTSMDNEEYVQSSLKYGRFSSIMYGAAPYCADVYEWYVPSNELPEYYCLDNFITPKPKTNGSVTHTPSPKPDPTSGGSNDTDEDPAHPCGEYSSYGWTGGDNPSCEDIKGSLPTYL